MAGQTGLRLWTSPACEGSSIPLILIKELIEDALGNVQVICSLW